MRALPPELGEDLVWAQHRPRSGRVRSERSAALFLDRDGVIVEEVVHLCEVEKTRLIPGAGEVIARANQAGLYVAVVTNQSGVGRRLFDWDDFRLVQEKIHADLAAFGAHIDAVFACPYHPEVAAPYRHPDHPARKPNPGMLLQAAEMLEIELAGSWIVGDRAGDLEAGRRAGIAGGLHVLTGFGAEEREMADALAVEAFQVLTGASLADALELLPPLAR